jgi:hypothetical protein
LQVYRKEDFGHKLKSVSWLGKSKKSKLKLPPRGGKRGGKNEHATVVVNIPVVSEIEMDAHSHRLSVPFGPEADVVTGRRGTMDDTSEAVPLHRESTFELPEEAMLQFHIDAEVIQEDGWGDDNDQAPAPTLPAEADNAAAAAFLSLADDGVEGGQRRHSGTTYGFEEEPMLAIASDVYTVNQENFC